VFLTEAEIGRRAATQKKDRGRFAIDIVEGDLGVALVAAAAHVAAERGGAAGLDRAHHPAPHPVEMTGLRRARFTKMAAEDARPSSSPAMAASRQASGTTSSVSRSSGLWVRPMVTCKTWV
jgi:hypothetical protein